MYPYFAKNAFVLRITIVEDIAKVVSLQTEIGMLEERHTISVPV